MSNYSIIVLQNELMKNNTLIERMNKELKSGMHQNADMKLAFRGSIKFCEEQNKDIKKAIEILTRSGDYNGETGQIS